MLETILLKDGLETVMSLMKLIPEEDIYLIQKYRYLWKKIQH